MKYADCRSNRYINFRYCVLSKYRLPLCLSFLKLITSRQKKNQRQSENEKARFTFHEKTNIEFPYRKISFLLSPKFKFRKENIHVLDC